MILNKILLLTQTLEVLQILNNYQFKIIHQEYNKHNNKMITQVVRKDGILCFLFNKCKKNNRKKKKKKSKLKKQ